MHFPPLRKVASVLCATFLAIPAASFAGEMMKYTKQNFAISLPDTWEDVTDVNPSKGLIAFFLAPDRKRMVLVFRDDKVPPAGELDEKFMEEYEKSIGVTGGNQRLTGKLVFVQGVKSYERTGVGEWRKNSASAFGTIEPGQVTGIDQVAVVSVSDVERVRLRLSMAVGIGPSRDDIWLTGDPDLHLTVPNGLHGDTATAAALVNTIDSIRKAEPGLRVMSELRPPRPALVAS